MEEACNTELDITGTNPSTVTIASEPGEDTDACHKLQEVYGNTIHQNNGRHLDVGTPNDTDWQARCDTVVANLHQLYATPRKARSFDHNSHDLRASGHIQAQVEFRVPP